MLRRDPSSCGSCRRAPNAPSSGRDMYQRNGLTSIPAGEVRRDCEPHRGPFLQLLGAVCMLLGALSLCLLLPSLAGFPLGLWVWRMARGDQEKMHVGLMDPDGRG